MYDNRWDFNLTSLYLTTCNLSLLQNVIHRVRPAMGRGLSLVLPVPLPEFSWPRVSVLPNALWVIMTTVIEPATVRWRLQGFRWSIFSSGRKKLLSRCVKHLKSRSGLSYVFVYYTACDSQCLSCDMGGVCTSCRDPTKVLLFGECQYDSCAHQYYLNTTTHACQGTTLSPWRFLSILYGMG